jgi:small subunit ribosomal protein S13
MAYRKMALKGMNSSLYQELNKIHGIGRFSITKICKHFNVLPHNKVHELSEQKVHEITGFLSKNFLIEDNLIREIKLDINRLISISCYRGLRHKTSMPLRGQRTHTNAKTQKRIGNRVQKRKFR